MAFESPDLENSPLLLREENVVQYYDTFTEAPRKTSKHDIREATTAMTADEMTGFGWEQTNRPSDLLHSSNCDDDFTATESSESRDSTPSSTPDNEEISYSAFVGISAPGDPVETRHTLPKMDWAALSRLYESFLGCSETKSSMFKQRMTQWILVALVGCLSALMAFVIDNIQAVVFDIKYGFCSNKWYFNKRKCCSGFGDCTAWRGWSSLFQTSPSMSTRVDILIYVSLVLTLSVAAGALTLLSRAKKSNSENDPLCTLTSGSPSINSICVPAAGSGVREIKLIANGFRLESYLTRKTVLIKSIAMILSTASGLSIGKEGPFIHLGAGISAWISTIFHVDQGEVKQLLLCGGAASGLAVTFGVPISGVVFVLEELSFIWTPKHLMLILFCSIVASLCLLMLEPFGNRMSVLIDVRYTSNWKSFEIITFSLLGALGGVLGALFVKACRFWAKTYRRIPTIKRYPLMDIVIIALLTGISSYWNKYTKLGDSELLSNLAANCNSGATLLLGFGNCGSEEPLSILLGPLVIAFVVKGVLSIVSFGLCVPAGIYVPSMAMGALAGKIVGYSVEALSRKLPLTASCPTGKVVSCVNPEVYALIGAGAMMCGVTRLPVALTVILFELTGSLNYVTCFGIAIFVSKWAADCTEPCNIYDVVGDLHGYPRLEKGINPMTGTLGDHLPSISHESASIDISSSPIVPSSMLQQKLNNLLLSNETQGGLVIIARGMPINFIDTSSLEKALGRIRNGVSTACLLSPKVSGCPQEAQLFERESDLASYLLRHGNEIDLTSYLLPPPISLELQTPIAFVRKCFWNLGLDYICAAQNGKYIGLVRKQDLHLKDCFDP